MVLFVAVLFGLTAVANAAVAIFAIMFGGIIPFLISLGTVVAIIAGIAVVVRRLSSKHSDPC